MPMQNFTRSFSYTGKTHARSTDAMAEDRALRFTPRPDVLRRITAYSKALEVTPEGSLPSFDVVVN